MSRQLFEPFANVRHPVPHADGHGNRWSKPFGERRGLGAREIGQRRTPADCRVVVLHLLDQFVGRYVLGQTDQGFPVLHKPEQDEPQLLLGMMTLRELRRFTFNEWSLTRVGEAMTPAHRIRALAPEMAAREAFRTLLESGEEQLPVIEGGALLGILRRRDLVRYIQMRLKQPIARRR